MVNASQTRVAEYRYDPYGRSLYIYDSLPSGGNRYRFSSKELVTSGNLYYYGHRFYDPNLQRWLSRDPIGEKGGRNLYGFVKNSPANYFDSDGRLIGIIIVGGVAIAVEGVYLYCTRESVCLRYVQANLQYAANLVDNMPEYANEPGSTTIEGQGTPQDALKHCIAACEVTKHPGVCRSANRAYVILQGREGTDPLSQGDMLNNQAGFDVGRGGGDCRTGCQQALRDGLLFGVNQQDGTVFRFPRQP
jgi:RHS repeat-associated protein